MRKNDAYILRRKRVKRPPHSIGMLWGFENFTKVLKMIAYNDRRLLGRNFECD